MRNPFIAAVAASAGTIVVMGGATLVVSSIGISVAKRVVARRKMITAVQCIECCGSGYRPCDICLGESMVKSRRPVSVQRLTQRYGSPGDLNQGPVYVGCPACGSTNKQRCLNCLGLGKYNPEL